MTRRPSFIEFLVAFAIGIAVYFSLKFELFLSDLWLLVPVILVLVFFSKQHYALRFVFSMLASLLVGVFYVGFYSHMENAPTLTYETGVLRLEGVAVEVKRLAGEHEQLTLGEVTYPESYNGRRPSKVRITVRVNSPFYESGDKLRVVAVLSPPPRPVYPSGYDSARQFFYSGIGARGFAIAPVEVLSTNPAGETWFSVVEHLRDRIGFAIEQHLDGQTAAVATALLTGQKSKISNDVKEDMRISGLAHLLAISGLHMALLTGFLFFSVRALLALSPRITLLYPIKKIAAVVAWFGGAYYLLISGLGVSTIRAFIMVSVVLLAVLLDRQAISMRLLAFAAFIVLLLDPSALVSASFQMSFSAVFGLIAVYEGWRNYVHRQYAKSSDGLDYDTFSEGRTDKHPLPKIFRNRFFAYPLGVLSSTLIAEVSLLPVSVYHFHRFSTYGMAANLAVMPIMGFWIMPFGLFALLLFPFGLEGLALVPMGLGIDAMLYVANIVANEEGSSIHLTNLPMSSYVAVVMAAIFMVWLKGRVRLLSVLALFGFSGYMWVANTPPQMIVENGGKMLALSDGNGGYYFTDLRSGRFARNSWGERFGLAETPHIRELIKQQQRSGEENPISISCDQSGCIYEIDGRTIGLPKTYSAVAEDCLRVDMLITQLRVQGVCPTPNIIIDSKALRQGGAHAIWFNEEGDNVTIKTVEGERGKRLWSFGSN
ncbi:MAG: ComEC/Rec2 family competence protein [Sphingomonadales bacterium]|nr:ComEC/Rec2 family competence protein [Sphingomonadales bacterium]